jgi:hypothetical protein
VRLNGSGMNYKPGATETPNEGTERAEERHWRRMEQQNRRSPIVTGLAAYGAYKAYEAFTSDDDEEEEIEALRKQNAELKEKLRELMLKKSDREWITDSGLEDVQHSPGEPTPASEPIRDTKLGLFFLLACVMVVLAVYALFGNIAGR